MAYSSDGQNWTAVGDSKFGTFLIRGITWGSNKFFAVGSSGKKAYSSDGISWTAVEDSIYVGNGIAWGNNKFVAVGSQGRMAYSPDGINWTAVTNF